MRLDTFDIDDPRYMGERRARDWWPLVAYVVSTVLALGLLYGKLGGRLDLIEYRLQLIEQKLK